MTEEIKSAIERYWIDWHKDSDPDDIPDPNISFERGFLCGVDYAKKRDAACKTKVPGK